MSAAQYLWLAALMGLHAVAEWCVPWLVSSWPQAAVVQDALLFSQWGLLIVWGVFGPGAWYWRIPAAGFLGWMLVRQAPLSEDTRSIMWVELGMLLSVLLVVRLLRRSLQHFAEQKIPAAGEFQFSIRHMLIWTVVAALLFVGGRWVRPMLQEYDPLPGWVVYVSLGFSFTLVALLNLWGTLPIGASIWRWVPVLFLAAAIGAGLPVTLGRNDDWIIISAWTFTQSLLLGGSLLLLRQTGYRLCRKAITVPQEA